MEEIYVESPSIGEAMRLAVEEQHASRSERARHVACPVLIRAVPDPNVLVTGLISPKGISARLVDLAENGLDVMVVSANLLGETKDVLLRPGFMRSFPEEAARLRVASPRGEAAGVRRRVRGGASLDAPRTRW